MSSRVEGVGGGEGQCNLRVLHFNSIDGAGGIHAETWRRRDPSDQHPTQIKTQTQQQDGSQLHTHLKMVAPQSGWFKIKT